ncbi:MAG: hypothetical protein A3H27_14755 [Acidobacteria bacterium RIFCSPLOWO2_02_FULL_59_13]|nr:MAG: hypothetical protein A3H27_14755 [Acidobacteria bacterium RIFCSPLOWO2_02_FULL_59_13]
MGKKGKRPKGSPGGKRKSQYWPAVIAVVVLVAAVSSYLLSGSGPLAGEPAQSLRDTTSAEASSSPSLRNRMVLPAQPQTPRPFTLNPASFSDPEVQKSYQVARAVPEVLEYMACYCGCYGSSGHRNNLDCFKDNHGAT